MSIRELISTIQRRPRFTYEGRTFDVIALTPEERDELIAEITGLRFALREYRDKTNDLIREREI